MAVGQLAFATLVWGSVAVVLGVFAYVSYALLAARADERGAPGNSGR